MKAVVMDLLRQYLKVEIQFQNGKEHLSIFLYICCVNIIFILSVALTFNPQRSVLAPTLCI